MNCSVEGPGALACAGAVGRGSASGQRALRSAMDNLPAANEELIFAIPFETKPRPEGATR